jgi:hypothetical protein
MERNRPATAGRNHPLHQLLTLLALPILMLRPSLAIDSGPQWKMKGRDFTLRRLYSSLLFSYVSSAKKTLPESGPSWKACREQGTKRRRVRQARGCRVDGGL